MCLHAAPACLAASTLTTTTTVSMTPHAATQRQAAGDAVNMQKDIIFDGTMTWAPFVEQTVAMVRDHKHNYRMGPGYHKDEDGNVVERCAYCSSAAVSKTAYMRHCSCCRQAGCMTAVLLPADFYIHVRRPSQHAYEIPASTAFSMPHP